MKSINAPVPTNSEKYHLLSMRRCFSNLDTSSIKRSERRNQRRKLRADLRASIQGGIDTEFTAPRMEVVAPPAPKKPHLFLVPALTDASAQSFKTVTVTRKRPLQRKVVEQLRIAA